MCRFVDRDMFARFRGGGMGHKSTRYSDQVLAENVEAGVAENEEEDSMGEVNNTRHNGEVGDGGGQELEKEGEGSDDEKEDEEELGSGSEGDDNEGIDGEDEEVRVADDSDDDMYLGAEDGEDPTDVVEEEGYGAL
jgi:hypothetical protein